MLSAVKEPTRKVRLAEGLAVSIVGAWVASPLVKALVLAAGVVGVAVTNGYKNHAAYVAYISVNVLYISFAASKPRWRWAVGGLVLVAVCVGRSKTWGFGWDPATLIFIVAWLVGIRLSVKF